MVKWMSDPNSFWQTHKWGFALLALVALVQVFGLCQTWGDFWFEDDAPHRVFVRDHNNALAYFGPELVKKLSLGHSVTPWFPFTFWMDHQMSAEGAMPAYLHTGFSLWLTACALFVLAGKLMNPRWALAVSVVWFWLPSTVVITEFLSTRHYLEGCLLSCISLALCLHSNEQEGRRRMWFTLGAAVFYLLATTTKEVYVSATWVLLLGFYAYAKRWAAVVGTVLCGVAYAGYRLLSLGLVGKSLGESFASRYHLFLARWPYMFTGNEGGYLLVALVTVVVLVLLWQRKLPWLVVVFIGGFVGAMLLTIFPVSANVTDQYKDMGTWYRVVFLLNTAMLFLGAILVYRLEKPKVGLVMGVLTALLCIPGAWKTSRYWDELKASYTSEAQYYLAHDDRLLYSRLPAPWYLYGIHHLYKPDQEAHYLTWRVDNGTPKDYVQARVAKYKEIWDLKDGTYQADPELLAVIAANCEEDITPLHKEREETEEEAPNEETVSDKPEE